MYTDKGRNAFPRNAFCIYLSLSVYIRVIRGQNVFSLLCLFFSVLSVSLWLIFF
jgi:hypothetical protein